MLGIPLSGLAEAPSRREQHRLVLYPSQTEPQTLVTGSDAERSLRQVFDQCVELPGVKPAHVGHVRDGLASRI